MTFDIKEFLTENKTTINEGPKLHSGIGGYAGTAFEQLGDVEGLLYQGKGVAEGSTDGARGRGVAKMFEEAIKHVVAAQKLMKAVEKTIRNER